MILEGLIAGYEIIEPTSPVAEIELCPLREEDMTVTCRKKKARWKQTIQKKEYFRRVPGERTARVQRLLTWKSPSHRKKDQLWKTFSAFALAEIHSAFYKDVTLVLFFQSKAFSGGLHRTSYSWLYWFHVWAADHTDRECEWQQTRTWSRDVRPAILSRSTKQLWGRNWARQSSLDASPRICGRNDQLYEVACVALGWSFSLAYRWASPSDPPSGLFSFKSQVTWLAYRD